MIASTHPAALDFSTPVIAHRGASLLAPENTMAAYRRAQMDGAVWMETDIKLSQDGVPLLMHDDRLERTTNGRGLVASTGWDRISMLDAGSWFDPSFAHERVPSFGEFGRFVVANNLRLNIELKPCPGRSRATAMVTLIEVTKLWPERAPPPLISSFDVESLMIAANLHPECPRGLLLDDWRDDWQDVAQQTAAQTLHLRDRAITKERADKIIASGLLLLAYVVNDPLRAKELLDWGISAVFSDNPCAILKAL